ncbi:hypothetical protein Prudu_94S000400, partial [Prunus dulcis]
TSAPSNRSSGHHTWGRSPGPVPNEPPLDGEPPPTQRRRCRCWNRPEIAMEADGSVRTSSLIFSSNSPPNRSSKRFIDLLFMDNQASEVQPISMRKLQRAVEVRGIHHRAILSFHVSSQGKKVICARHSPGVGHAQDLARIPKWKLGRVLSLLTLMNSVAMVNNLSTR